MTVYIDPAGNNFLGNRAEDELYMNDGDDTVTGVGFAQQIYGGSGNDILGHAGPYFSLIHGGSGDDRITGSTTADELSGDDGADKIEGDAFIDRIDGGQGDDVLYGYSEGGDSASDAADEIYGGGGIDLIFGQTGNDYLEGGLGDDILDGGRSDDTMYGSDGLDRFEGGPGADRLDGGAGVDQAQYTFAAAGIVADLLNPSLNKGEAKGDTYFGIENLRGTLFNDVLRGNNGPNGLGGWNGGNDRLFGLGGADTLNGGNGNDVLTGGLGRDTLTADTGADRFDFDAISETPKGSGRDVIADFSRVQADRIDLSTIDAYTGAAGNQKFVFIGAQTFASYHATHLGTWGMIRYAGGVVQGNVNTNLATDFEIRLAGAPALATGDLFL